MLNSAETLLVFRNSQGIDCRATIMNLSRDMIVFEVYNPYSIVQLSEVLSGVLVRRGTRTLYDGKAVVSNLVNTGLMLIVSATLVDPWSNLASFEPGETLRGEVAAFIEGWQATNAALRPSFQCKVSNFRNFLEETSRWISQGEMEAGVNDRKTDERFRTAFFEDLTTQLVPKLCTFYNELSQEAATIPGELVPEHKSFTQRELHPLVLCSPFVHRTFTKPLGYAGDYEMVNMMLRDPAEGQSSYAKLINILNLTQGAAVAHRNRITLLVEHLLAEAKRIPDLGRPFHALNVGCGPAHELQRLVAGEAHPEAFKFTLLDFNAETLSHAREAIIAKCRPGGAPEIATIHKSIHTLLKDALGRGDSQPPVLYDMVYCAGLFDYLSDKICQRLLRLFLQWTKPGGLVLATNVHNRNPMRGLMEFLLEWHLIHRNEQDMLALTQGHRNSNVHTDATGINIFLLMRNPDPLT
jgi:extracellular factor (EF) 3-hydroxypalmitic acid methyl ester biosynthesis protein